MMGWVVDRMRQIEHRIAGHIHTLEPNRCFDVKLFMDSAPPSLHHRVIRACITRYHAIFFMGEQVAKAARDIWQ
jgi:hypothetical protein